MEIARYLFNVVTESGRFIGQAFQATGADGTAKILTTSHQARLNAAEAFILEPYIGKSRRIPRNSFFHWKKNHIKFDVAEISLRRGAGGIPVAIADDSEMPMRMPSSRLYPKVVAQMLKLHAIRVTNSPISGPYTIYYESWREEDQPNSGNSGAPLLNEKGHVVAVATHKVKGTYAGLGQLIAWKFRIR